MFLLEDIYSYKEFETINTIFQTILDEYVIENKNKSTESYINIKVDSKLDGMLVRIQNLINKVFNIRSVISIDNKNPNKFTYGMCVFLTHDEINSLVEDVRSNEKTGYVFHKSKEIVINIEEGLLKFCKKFDMNGKHLTAILLHEIGHKALIKTQVEIDRNGNVKRWGIFGISFYTSMLLLPNIVLASLILLASFVTMNMLSITNYSAVEGVSDSFAVNYGYGKEIYEVIHIMENAINGTSLTKKSGLINWFQRQMNLFFQRKTIILKTVEMEIRNKNNSNEQIVELKKILKNINEYK